MEQRRNDQDKFQQPPRMKPPEMPNQNHNHQPPPPQKCPRCDSSNTKFCYYNNYSLSQPRYFCKACRRYWTHGGTLRNVPVGGGCRKSKRPKPSTPSPSSAEVGRAPPATAPLNSISGQVLRPLPPMMSSSSMGNTFYSSGSFLSAMQSLSPAVSVGGQYDANIALLQSLKPQAQQFQLQNQNDHYFPPQQNLRPSALTSWTQSFINNRGSGAGSSGFWSGDGNNQAEAGSSFNPNDQWQDSNPGGFDDPSSNIP